MGLMFDKNKKIDKKTDVARISKQVTKVLVMVAHGNICNTRPAA